MCVTDPRVQDVIKQATFHALAHNTDVFSADALKRAAAEFYGMGWEGAYFLNHEPRLLASHLYGYLCAKADGNVKQFFYTEYNANKGEGVIITTRRDQDLQIADAMIDDKFLAAEQPQKMGGVSVRCYFSFIKPSESPLLASPHQSGMRVIHNAIADRREQQQQQEHGLSLVEEFGLCMYVIKVTPFRTSDSNGPLPTSAGAGGGGGGASLALLLGSEYFYTQNTALKNRDAILKRYDDTLKAVSENISRTTTFSVTNARPTGVDEQQEGGEMVVHSHTTNDKNAPKNPGDMLCLQLGFKTLEGSSYFSSLSTLIHQIKNVRFVKKIVETFSNGMHVYTFYMRGAATEQDIRLACGYVGLLPSRKTSHKALVDLYIQEKMTAIESLYATAATIFAFYFTKPRVSEEYASLQKTLAHQDSAIRKLNVLNDSLFREVVQETTITQAIAKHLPLFHAIFAAFRSQVNSSTASAGTSTATAATIEMMRTSKALQQQTDRILSVTEREIFRAFLNFNNAICRTNMFKEDKAAMAFRLDPSAFFDGLDYPRVPYAIFLVVGAHFRGFHVRFHDISRGGIRIIRGQGPDHDIVVRRYHHNRAMLFMENFNLAYTQTLKNKDIPESGSKGTILVSIRAKAPNKVFYLQYVDAIMDLIVDDVPGVVDVRISDPSKSHRTDAQRHPRQELLFFGPDEGTADDFPNLAARHARRRGYRQWQSFATGKSPDMGGIPHDTYGCTTRSIRQYAEGVYRKLGLDQTTLTKFMTGGPDGDLGSNEIKLGKERIVAICDGTASVHDPNGIDHAELLRLATARKPLAHLDKSKLSPKGFAVGVNERNVTLPDGTAVENGTLLRDTFHFSKYADADVFVPCGGRPASVTLEKVEKLFKRKLPGINGDYLLSFVSSTTTPSSGSGSGSASGSKAAVDPADLRWKFVIEGANLFFTHDARIAAENAGIVLFKDASTNKGGVTSSSLEVLAGLALTEQQHRESMCFAPSVGGQKQEPPKFYASYVQDILNRIENNARMEFECLWSDARVHGHGGGLSTNVTDAISLKINRFKEFVMQSSLSKSNVALFRYILETYLPQTLRQMVSIDEVIERVPRPYLDAIFSMSIASGFVYSTGIAGNEFNFFQYMLELTKKAEAHAKAHVAKL